MVGKIPGFIVGEQVMMFEKADEFSAEPGDQLTGCNIETMFVCRVFQQTDKILVA